jgi:hypothetical protein
MSVVYFPVKFGMGVAGAFLGGVSGFLTGGNDRSAEGIWHPMTGGSYFITPQKMDKEEPFLPLDYGPEPAGTGAWQPVLIDMTQQTSAGPVVLEPVPGRP